MAINGPVTFNAYDSEPETLAEGSVNFIAAQPGRGLSGKVVVNHGGEIGKRYYFGRRDVWNTGSVLTAYTQAFNRDEFGGACINEARSFFFQTPGMGNGIEIGPRGNVRTYAKTGGAAKAKFGAVRLYDDGRYILTPYDGYYEEHNSLGTGGAQGAAYSIDATASIGGGTPVPYGGISFSVFSSTVFGRRALLAAPISGERFIQLQPSLTASKTALVSGSATSGRPANENYKFCGAVKYTTMFDGSPNTKTYISLVPGRAVNVCTFRHEDGTYFNRPLPAWAVEPVGAVKWMGGVAYGKYMICVPYQNPHIMIYDCLSGDIFKGPNVQSNSLNSGYYRGGCVAANGKIIFCPNGENQVGIYDFHADKFTYGPRISGAKYLYAGCYPYQDKVLFGGIRRDRPAVYTIGD